MYGKVDININEIDKYRDIVKAKRKASPFYNCFVVDHENKNVTIDDLFKRYDALQEKIGK